MSSLCAKGTVPVMWHKQETQRQLMWGAPSGQVMSFQVPMLIIGSMVKVIPAFMTPTALLLA